MNQTSDLRLAESIFPLFDYTLNEFSRERLFAILTELPRSRAAVEERQKIISGFLANADLLKDYSYSKIDFNETYFFLHSERLQEFHDKLKKRFGPGSVFKNIVRSNLAQVVIVFKRIANHYINRIDSQTFPSNFREEILAIHQFLASLQMHSFESIIDNTTVTKKQLKEFLGVLLAKQKSKEIERFYQRLFLFEAYLSISKGMQKHEFCVPEFSNETFSAEAFYHPLIKTPVKNSLSIEQNVLLITGPNMSGKSSLLKALSICVYLAHAGAGVPAAKMVLPHFDHISFSFNHNDDLANGYSHFMHEIKRLKQVLIEVSAGKRCFAVFDELFKGTTVEDAIAISEKTIEGLTKFRESVFAISTHLHPLQNMDYIQDGRVSTYFLECTVHEQSPVFHYKLLAGWSNLKIGKLLFENEGLNGLLGI